MATLINNSTGNFTTAATWSLVDSTSLSDSEANQTNSTTSFVSSAAFTPGTITIDAIALKIVSRTAGGGTFSVRLAIAGVAVAGTTVTVNVADLPTTMNGWAVFKLSASILLVAATIYTVQIQSSVNATVAVWRTATAGDWSRMLRTTTTQAPAASDNLNICGEYTGAGTSNSLTVTMDNTSSTQFGKIETSGKGTLKCGTAASTAYQLFMGGAAGSFYVNGDGIVQFGTSGTPMPSTSSSLLKVFQNGAAVGNGILLRGNANFTTFGATKTQKAFLAADAAAAATTLTTDVSTGWKSGDLIAVCSTTRTSAESESVTLSSDATGTSVPVSALGFAHSGTGATKAEVGNLTRNVKIQGETTSLTAYILINDGVVFNVNNTEIYFLGSSTVNKRGIDVLTTNTLSGSVNIDGSVLRNFTNLLNFGLLCNLTTNANITVTNTNLFTLSTGISLNSTGMTATSITVNNILSILADATLNAQAATITNYTAASCTIAFAQIAVLTGISINNIVVHSSSGAGISFSGATSVTLPLSNVTAWRNTTRGLFFSGAHNISIDGVTLFGNATNGVELSTSSLIYLNNVTANAGTTLTQPIGISFTGSGGPCFITNSSFGATTTHATGDISVTTIRSRHEGYFNNCVFASTTEVAGISAAADKSIIASTKHDQTTGVHKLWTRFGIITSDSTINSTSPLSQRLTPNSATNKLITRDKSFSIPSGKTAKITVGVRKSVAGDGTAYNGNLPRLWLRSNNSAGISSDTLLATATAASLGAWEFITATITSANDDTVNKIYIDCDGTTGWVNVDVWKLEIINGSANGTNVNGNDYWNDGAGFIGINGLTLKNTGEESYWINGAPMQELFPVSAVQTGKFFLQF